MDSKTNSSKQRVAKQGPVAPVQLVDHTQPSLTALPASNRRRTYASVPPSNIQTVAGMDAPVIAEGYRPTAEGNAVPTSGHIPMPPSHSIVTSSGTACDALPGGCGCGDSMCGGSCGFEAVCGVEPGCGVGMCDGGCDSMGGNGCCSMCGEIGSPNAWRPCMTLCLPQDGWVTFEYLAWWQDGMDLPPLVTTSTDPNVARAQAGVLGAPTTQVLFGGTDILDDAFDGYRFGAGVWLDRCHKVGLGGEFFRIGTENDFYSRTSGGNPVLARPFINALNGLEDAELVAFPNVVSGNVSVAADSRLTGASVYLRWLRNCAQGCDQGMFCGCPEHFCSRSEMLFGLRHLELRENVTITEDLISTDSTAPGQFEILDGFHTRNQFNGVDMGWQYRRTRGFWTFDSRIKLALGNTRQTVRIRGNTTITDTAQNPATEETFNGGLLAQVSNIGTHKRDEFSVVPEISVNLGYQLTDQLRATLGYNFIYWSNVVRPGDHILRTLNPNQLPPESNPFVGGRQPEFAFNSTDYWAQGISVGGEYRW